MNTTDKPLEARAAEQLNSEVRNTRLRIGRGGTYSLYKSRLCDVSGRVEKGTAETYLHKEQHSDKSAPGRHFCRADAIAAGALAFQHLDG